MNPEPSYKENGFLLLFQVGKENYGIPLEQVLEVILPPRLIRIPGDPEMAEGIIGYRGDAFTVIRTSALAGAKIEFEKVPSDKCSCPIYRAEKAFNPTSLMNEATTNITSDRFAEYQFNSQRIPSLEKKSDLEEKVILLNPAPVLGGTMRIALRADRVRGVFRREEGKTGAVSEAARGAETPTSILEKCLEFKDARGGSITADLIDLAEFRKKIVSS